jgi:hypothetical protein
MHLKSVVLVAMIGGSALSAVACSRNYAKLSPAPEASVAAGPGEGATTTVDGVRVTARAQAWQWDPSDLNTKVTPLLIELENNGNHPLLVRYNSISLVDSMGHRFNVMPPYDINGAVAETYRVSNPYYGFNRFFVAPYLSRWYPRFSPYSGAFAYNSAYYSPYLTQYRDVQLPTVDMVQRALPEGVLQPGGTAMGFVYFQRLDRDARTLTLDVDLADAQTGASIGSARIPFVTR